MAIDECVAVLNKNSKYDDTTDYADHQEAKQEINSEELKVVEETSHEETPVIGGGGNSESNAVKKKREDKKSQGVVDDEDEKVLFDDWEGIERTDLEQRFGAAVAFVASKSNANWIRNEVRIKLQGLHKIATQGPCRGPQPMALKFSARSEWKAWRRLGDMSAESAMEQYLALLSSSTPGWEENK